jgi:hypothetical protein
MPFNTLTIIPTVDAERTPSDVSMGIVSSNFIRWRDRTPEKRGGWTLYANTQFPGIIRELHGWQGLNQDKHLAVGTTDGLFVLSSGNVATITPENETDSIVVNLSTVSGSIYVNIVDNTYIGQLPYNTVVINTPVSVGGVTLFGAYQINENTGSNSYNVAAAIPATSTVTNGGAVATFSTVAGSPQVTVTLANHTYYVGQDASFPISTSGGGVTIFGQYVVTSVPSSSTFTINASNLATSSVTFPMNGGDLALTYWVVAGPSISGSGYGLGGYGLYGYGYGLGTSYTPGTPITAMDWFLDNWGEILLACPVGGPIFTWSIDSGFGTGAIIPTAPIANAGMFVAMPEQQIMAWGSTDNGIQDPLLIEWSDAGDFTQWTPATTNQAGNYRIPTGSQIVRGLQGPNQCYWFTDVDLYVSQYIGYPFIWGFNKVAAGCGLIAPKAAVVLGASVFWMSQKQFFVSSAGGAPQPIPCSVWDVVFQNLNLAYVNNIRAASNAQFNEIAWYFPSSASSSGENDTYVVYNALYNEWDFGSLNRSAWIDQSVLGGPIGSSSSGYLYQHETSNDAAGLAISASFTTGYASLSSGNDLVFVDWVLPDMRWSTYATTASATVSITFNVVDYPGDTPVSYGPFTFTKATEYLEPRFRGRYMQVVISSSDVGSFWRLGSIRYRYAPDGRR